jgi:hypothetical protein
LQKALSEIEQPRVKWKVILQIVLGLGVLWALAFGLVPWMDYWGVGVVGVLTAIVAGFGVYVLRLTRKSRAIVDILKEATDDAGRRAAIEKLGEKGNDALNAVAKAQLLAQENPAEAMATLEAVDLAKAPAVMQDEIRAQLAMMYLVHGRTRDARALADLIRLDRQPQPKAKAMYAAVMAEAFARTGAKEEARKLVDTYDANDPAYGETAAMLYRAQVYTYTYTKNRGLAQQAIERLLAIDPNMVVALAVKGGNPTIGKLAKETLQRTGSIPKQKVRMRMR